MLLDLSCSLASSFFSRLSHVSCGERHTVFLTSHRPMFAKELPALKPYFRIIEEEGNSKTIIKKLKKNLVKEGLEPALIDDPNAPLPGQAGHSSSEMKNDPYEKGLR
jgi:hypothetical protein